jgi:NADH-ubiquinone oxidoreductase chain 1
MVVFMIPLGLLMFSSILAETNRTPFDFAEGESELVSGFNVEYRGGYFAFIFIGEYVRILFIRFMYVIFFFGRSLGGLLFYLRMIFISFLFL